MDLLNPYLDLYNGNAAHMMAYFNLGYDTDPKVITAYQECIDLQQQLHNCGNILKRLQNTSDCNERTVELISKGLVTSESLLDKASTDKLRVITENVVDMLLYFVFQMDDVVRFCLTLLLLHCPFYISKNKMLHKIEMNGKTRANLI